MTYRNMTYSEVVRAILGDMGIETEENTHSFYSNNLKFAAKAAEVIILEWDNQEDVTEAFSMLMNALSAEGGRADSLHNNIMQTIYEEKLDYEYMVYVFNVLAGWLKEEEWKKEQIIKV